MLDRQLLIQLIPQRLFVAALSIALYLHMAYPAHDFRACGACLSPLSAEEAKSDGKLSRRCVRSWFGSTEAGVDRSEGLADWWREESLRHCSSTTSDNSSQNASRTTAATATTNAHTAYGCRRHEAIVSIEIERAEMLCLPASAVRDACPTCMWAEEHRLLSEVWIVNSVTEQPGATSRTDAVQLKMYDRIDERLAQCGVRQARIGR